MRVPVLSKRQKQASGHAVLVTAQIVAVLVL